MSGGFSLKKTSWASVANVLTLDVPVLLMTIGIITRPAFMVPWVCRACLRGSYMVYMWSTASCILPSVEYLHSTSRSCPLPRNVGSMMRCPSESVMYPTALTRSGL